MATPKKDQTKRGVLRTARISSQEEQVLRMKQGHYDDDEILTKKTTNPELLARLLEIEQRIIAHVKKSRG